MIYALDLRSQLFGKLLSIKTNFYYVNRWQNVNSSRPSGALMPIRCQPNFLNQWLSTVYPKKYAHGFVVLCFAVVIQSFIMNSHEVLIHIHQGCFTGTAAIVGLPQCQWSKPDGYGKISQCITTTKHSKANTVCIVLPIYCIVSVTKGTNAIK